MHDVCMYMFSALDVQLIVGAVLGVCSAICILRILRVQCIVYAVHCLGSSLCVEGIVCAVHCVFGSVCTHCVCSVLCMRCIMYA